MSVSTDNLIELMNVSEAARRLSVVRNTLANRIEASGIRPDAIMIQGAKQVRSPLFHVERLKELAKIAE